MADRMCCWANCENETVAVTVSIKGNPGERLVYCCLEHAASGLKCRQDQRWKPLPSTMLQPGENK